MEDWLVFCGCRDEKPDSISTRVLLSLEQINPELLPSGLATLITATALSPYGSLQKLERPMWTPKYDSFKETLNF